MNKARRNELTEVKNLIYDAYDKLESAKDDEEEYKDNIPENLQGGERYEAAEEAVYLMEECLDQLDRVIDSLSDIIDA